MARYVRPANMRQAFMYPHKEHTHFFPGHMHSGMKAMQRKLKSVDCILEMHDARIPLSGRNPQFMEALLVRPHILLLNKADVADARQKDRVKDIYREQGVSRVMYINCTGDASFVRKKLLPTVIETIHAFPRYNRAKEKEYNLLVIGIPNVGKSSLINLLRKNKLKKAKNATHVAPQAGVTRSVLEKIKVSENPTVYVFDTPGIQHPNISDMKTGMNLALVGTIKDSLLGNHLIVDYMLYKLNQFEIFKYVDFYKLPGPTDDVLELLAVVAKNQNFLIRKKNLENQIVMCPNFDIAAQLVLKDFRAGKLGKVNLDKENMFPTSDKSSEFG